MVAELFTSGRVVDIILVLMAMQGLVLTAVHGRTGKGVALVDYLVSAVPGACLLLALRASLVDARWAWMAMFLLAALLSHWLDLWHRAGRR